MFKNVGAVDAVEVIIREGKVRPVGDNKVRGRRTHQFKLCEGVVYRGYQSSGLAEASRVVAGSAAKVEYFLAMQAADLGFKRLDGVFRQQLVERLRC